jgi:hypothetical protein
MNFTLNIYYCCGTKNKLIQKGDKTMSKTTDLDSIKTIAISFLNLEPIQDEKFSFIIHHPFFQSDIFYTSNTTVVNIIEDIQGLEEARTILSHIIDHADNVDKLVELVCKPYRLTFYKYINSFLSDIDYGELLKYIWICSENPNQDVNCSLSEIKEWFRSADKKCLMSDFEYAKYSSMQAMDKIKIYRGVAVNRNNKGISWTTDKNIATWYAKRFDKKGDGEVGYVQTISVAPKEILAYFEDDDEIIADIRRPDLIHSLDDEK